MRRYLYLSTAVAGVIMATGNALGQCVVTQDCAAMGYTKSSCPDGNGVKCPFGNSWFCVDLCGSGYKYTCSGTGYAGGVGSACGGKYTSCTCASKYSWNGSACTACGSSYKYTCSGTGYAGGSGTACGGKYTKCNCSNNYTWNGSNCVLSCSSSYKYTCSGTPEALALPVVASMLLVPAPAVMSGKMAAVRNKHRMEQLASCIIATVKLWVYVLQVWASMSR